MILRETRCPDDGGSNNSTTAVCERDVYPSACRWARQLTIIPQVKNGPALNPELWEEIQG